MTDSQPFAWHETFAIVNRAWKQRVLAFDRAQHAFVATDAGAPLRIVLPRLLPVRDVAPDPAVFLEQLEARPRLGRCALVLVQAGASALTLHDDDTLIAHKVIKKYVVRGNGRAQPLHLKTRGKSRYGSRLRLQNYSSQLSDTLEKLHEWWGEFGAFERVHLSGGARLLHDLLESEPGVPWSDSLRVEAVPFHVHVPDFAEVKRVRWRLTHGEIEGADSSQSE